jgi:predicted phage terminase large subunit-like protein
VTDLNDKLVDDLLLKMEREAATREGGYYDFFVEAWPHIDPTPLVEERYVKFLCDHMEALMRGTLESRRLLINIPPGHSKSMICVVMSLPYLWTLDPSAYVIYCHKDIALARDMARKTRLLVQSEYYQERWPDIRIMDDAKKVDRFSNNHGGGRAAITVRQQVTGMHAKGKLGALIVIDDPDRPDDTTNDAADIAKWYSQVLPTRFGSLSKSQICIVQQRISQRDLSAYVLDSAEDYTHVCLPMEYDPERACSTPVGEDWRVTKGDILSPLRTSKRDIERLKEHFDDPRIGHAQLQQQPVPEDGNIFKVEHFTGRYDALPRAVQYTISADLTFTGETTSDYAVLTVWARGLSDGKHYLVNMIRKKMGFVESCQRILDAWRYYPRSHLLIEKSASGYAVLEMLYKMLEEEEVGASGRVHEFKTGRNSKEARASTVSYLFDRGDVRFPRQATWMTDVINEMTAFPAARHDDIVDSVCNYLAWITGEKPTDLYSAFLYADKMAARIRA